MNIKLQQHILHPFTLTYIHQGKVQRQELSTKSKVLTIMTSILTLPCCLITFYIVTYMLKKRITLQSQTDQPKISDIKNRMIPSQVSDVLVNESPTTISHQQRDQARAALATVNILTNARHELNETLYALLNNYDSLENASERQLWQFTLDTLKKLNLIDHTLFESCTYKSQQVFKNHLDEIIKKALNKSSSHSKIDLVHDHQYAALKEYCKANLLLFTNQTPSTIEQNAIQSLNEIMLACDLHQETTKQLFNKQVHNALIEGIELDWKELDQFLQAGHYNSLHKQATLAQETLYQTEAVFGRTYFVAKMLSVEELTETLTSNAEWQELLGKLYLNSDLSNINTEIEELEALLNVPSSHQLTSKERMLNLVKSFRKWAIKNHPDKVPSSEKNQATERFQTATEKFRKIKDWLEQNPS